MLIEVLEVALLFALLSLVMTATGGVFAANSVSAWLACAGTARHKQTANDNASL